MKKILLFFVLSSFSVMALGEDSFFENEVLMSKIMPLPLNVKWKKLKDSQLPPEFRKNYPLTKGRVFVVGYKVVHEDNLAVILEVEKPYLDLTETFCRSRISVYYLHDYVLGSSDQDQLRNDFIDIGEFVNFNESQSKEGCPAQSYQDLKSYTLVQSLYGDDILIPLFKAAKQKLSKGDTLLTIGVSRTGSGSRGNTYYATVSRESGELETFNLSLSSTASFEQGIPRVTD